MTTNTATLSSREITEKIKNIVITALYAKGNISDVDEDAPLTSLGLDSLSVVDIFIGLEREFDLELDESELDMSVVESVKTLVDYVSSLLK